MAEPEYTLEFVLTYDKGRSLTFRGSSDDPWTAFLASNELVHLNSTLVSNRLYSQAQVTVNLYKDGQPLDKSGLSEEIRQYHESKRAQNK